jgi:hypothetical protein
LGRPTGYNKNTKMIPPPAPLFGFTMYYDHYSNKWIFVKNVESDSEIESDSETDLGFLADSDFEFED